MLKSVDGGQTEGELTVVRAAPARWTVVLALAIIYIVWGSTYLAMRLALDTMPPFLLAGTRFLVAGAIAYFWAWRQGAAALSRREIVDGFIAGALLLVGGNGGVVWALQTVPTGASALVVATVPLWVALLEWLRPGGVRPNVRTTLSLLLGMAGVAWLMLPRAEKGGGVPLAGGLILVGSSLSWSIGSLYIRARSEKNPQPFLKTVALQMLAGGTLLVLASLCCGEITAFAAAQLSWKSAGAMAYLVVAGSLLSYTAYGWLLTVVRPTLVATYAFVNPVVAVLLGCLLANEEPSADALCAGGVVVAAVALMVLAPRRSVPREIPRR